MTQLIKDHRLLSADEDTTAFIPLADFIASETSPDSAVLIDSHEEVEELASALPQISRIALNFPVFTDGRPYSTAVVLRNRLGFKGEIRAVGDVRLDQLEQMARCGFDAFEIGDQENAERALGKLSGYSHSYQQTFDRAPLFREARNA